MNAFKSFISGYVSGIITMWAFLFGRYIYGRTVSKITGNNAGIKATEREQSANCTRLEENQQRVDDLIQEATDVLQSGQHSSNT